MFIPVNSVYIGIWSRDLQNQNALKKQRRKRKTAADDLPDWPAPQLPHLTPSPDSPLQQSILRDSSRGLDSQTLQVEDIPDSQHSTESLWQPETDVWIWLMKEATHKLEWPNTHLKLQSSHLIRQLPIENPPPLSSFCHDGKGVGGLQLFPTSLCN